MAVQSEDSYRRRLGPRERAAMSMFWDQSDRFLTVREVGERLNAELAYTTVMTVLTRLYSRGHLERSMMSTGRAPAACGPQTVRDIR
jgi:predicted transcriptional regulator